MSSAETSAEEGQELIVEFVDEAIESLRDVPDQLEAFRLAPEDDGPINAVFRAVHSIKGCAGFLGLTTVKQFAHSLENTMDEVRKGKLILSEDLQRLLVSGIDLLEAMLGRALEGEIDAPLSTDEQQLLSDVDEAAKDCRLDGGVELDLLRMVKELAEEMRQSTLPEAEAWVKRCTEMLEAAAGQEREAEDAEEEELAGESVPPAPEAGSFKELKCKVAGTDVTSMMLDVLSVFWESEESGFKDEYAVQFEEAAGKFAAWAKENHQPELAAALEAAAVDLKTLVDSPLDVDPTLLGIVWDRLWPEFIKFEGVPAEVSQVESVPEEKTEPASNEKDAKQPTAASNKSAESQSKKARLIRIKEERLDSFMNEVSRLFITNELLKDLHARMSLERGMPGLVEELRQVHTSFNAQSSALQKSVLALRRVAAAGLFSKFPRMARTLASQLGKKVDVRLIGEDSEIDKSLVEDLDAPMTHMIRNSIDHGFEMPEDRLAAGKPESGTLTLAAEVTRSHVIISIQDDGRGLDPNKLRNKAVEKGLITTEQARAMPDAEALRLIFHAGFSTAEKLSDVSGRGVGMDVVRTNLLEHDGEIIVDSVVGEGSTFKLKIPIRDAVLVIDGLMLEQAGDSYVLPFEFIREIAEIKGSELKPVQGSLVATVRGQTFAAVSLGKILGISEDAHFSASDSFQAVLVGCKYGDLCLLVDRVRGHRQIVLNSLKGILPQTRNLAGVAQLGGGRLALVLSVEDIVRSLIRGSKIATVDMSGTAELSLQPS